MVSWLQESPWILASFSVRFFGSFSGENTEKIHSWYRKKQKADKQITTRKYAVNKQQQYLNLKRVE